MKNNEKKQKENIKEIILYLKGKREKLLGHKFRKLIHPIMLSTMKNMRKYDLIPIDQAEENQKLLEETLKKTPVIFAINHSNVHDVPTAGEIIKEHCYLLASDEVRGNFNGFLFELMGVVWVKRNNSEKNRIELSPKEHMLKLLEENQSIKTYPERTWNVTENEIVLPFKWGDVYISQQSQKPIIPIIMEYNYEKNICYYNIGKPMYISKEDDLIEANNRLRDEMATLRYNIWEKFDEERKTEINHLTGNKYKELAKKEYVEYKKKLIEEFPTFQEEEEAKMIYRPYTTSEEVYQHLKKIEPNHNNAFLFGKNKKI